jgi:DNA processing protein
MNKNIFWLALNQVKGIGAVRFNNLLNHFGTPQLAWEAPKESLRQAGLSERIVENLIKMRANVDLQSLWEKIENQNAKLVTWEDKEYPARLRNISQPPPVIYIKGDYSPADEWAVAIVGTRKVTSYGKQVTEDIASFLASQGITVISGLARGVDAIAHRAALKAGGRTIAVLGNGIDKVYPPEHNELTREIVRQGAIITDYPIGTPPDSRNFPPRNRMIAGLAIAVIVIEAGRKSGSVITAEFANEQGKEVFVVPGSIYSAQSVGTNRLIQEGANPLLSVEDLMNTLDLVMVRQHKSVRTILPSDAIEATLFGVLTKQPIHIDDIRKQTNLPIEKVSSTLAIMELKGMTKQIGKLKYIALRERQAVYTPIAKEE